MPIPYLNIYASTKAFVLSYSRALNEELKYRQIHVLAICPYWVETEFFDRAVEKDKKPVVIRYGKVYKAKDVIKKEVAEVLEMVGLTKYKDYYPVELSTSMLQRVVIARAFAVKPDILLMDEPYGQLDVELRFRLEDELIKLWQKLGTTVIFITHNIEEAVYLSENILVLTNKPTSIKHKLENTLPRPRNVVEPAFIDLRNQVTELIKWW